MLPAIVSQLGSTIAGKALGGLAGGTGTPSSTGSDGQSFGRIGSRIQSGITAGIKRRQAQENWEKEAELEKLRLSLLLQQAGELRDKRADKKMFRDSMLGIL